jgi:hypothetical protein
MKVPNPSELMPTAVKPTEMNAIDENAAMALGRPAFAYPRQDHLAHIQTHLTFALDPIFGSNQMIAPKCLPLEIEHIKQHMILWYTNQSNTYVTEGTDIDLRKYAESKMQKDIDQAVAAASTHVQMDGQKVFAQVIPNLQKLSGLLAQMAQQNAAQQKSLIQDPEANAVLQASMAETQRRAARDQADMKMAQDKLQIEVAMNAENNLTKERMKEADLTLDEVKLRQEQQETALTLQEAAQRNLRRD